MGKIIGLSALSRHMGISRVTLYRFLQEGKINPDGQFFLGKKKILIWDKEKINEFLTTYKDKRRRKKIL